MGGNFQSTLRTHYQQKNRFVRQFRDCEDTRKSEYLFDKHYISPHITYTNALKCIFPIAQEDLFEGNARKVLLVGSAGTGKTTFSLNSRYLWATNKLWEQFLYLYEINLSKLIKWEKKEHLCNSSPEGNERLSLCAEFLLFSLSEELKSQLVGDASDSMHGITIDSVKKTLSGDCSKVLLMFDGFDEIISDPSALKALDRLLSFLQSAYCITTLRPEAIDRELDCGKSISSFFDRTYTIHGFDRDGRNRYIRIQFPNDDVSSELINLIDRSDFPDELNTPLLLEMYCHLWTNEAGRNDLRTDFSIFQLYKQITDAHYDHYMNKCGLLSLEERQKIETFIQESQAFLAEVAFVSLFRDMDAREIDQHRLYQILNQEQRAWTLNTNSREKQSHFIGKVVSLGIIRRVYKTRVEHSSELFLFSHKSFKEYYAAFYVFLAYKRNQEDVFLTFFKRFLEDTDSLRLTMSFFLGFCFRGDRGGKERVLNLVFNQFVSTSSRHETFYAIGPVKRFWFHLNQIADVKVEDLPGSLQGKVRDLNCLLSETPFLWKDLMVETGYVRNEVIDYFLRISKEAFDLRNRQSRGLYIVSAITTLPRITRQLRLWQNKRLEIYNTFLEILKSLVTSNTPSCLDIIVAILNALASFSLIKTKQLEVCEAVKSLRSDDIINAVLPILRNTNNEEVIGYLVDVASASESNLRLSTRIAALMCLQKSLRHETHALLGSTKNYIGQVCMTFLRSYLLSILRSKDCDRFT